MPGRGAWTRIRVGELRGCGMPLSMRFTIHDDFLEARVAGVWRLDDVREVIEAVRAKGEESGLDRLLVDMQRVTGRPPDVHRFEAAEATANAARGRFRVALIPPSELSDRFFEDTARNRGAALHAHRNRDAALEWLLADDRHPPRPRGNPA